MRNLRELERYRQRGPEVLAAYGWAGDWSCGAFVVPSPVDKAPMVVLASSEGGWDHVSVSRKNRVPNWAEMEHIFRLFFRDDETAMQLHVPASEHVNMHPYCLHIWRPQGLAIPKPPPIFVGIGDQPARNQADALERLKTARMAPPPEVRERRGRP